MNKITSARFTDLDAIQLADGTVRLTQSGYPDEDCVIDLHPQQIRYLAERFAATHDRMTLSIQRRLLELQSDIQYFTDAEMWIDEIAARVSDGLAFQIGANAMCSAIDRIIADMGLVPFNAEPEQPPAEPPKPSRFKTQAPPKSQQQADLLTSI